MASEKTDEALLEGYKDGHSRDFDVFFERHWRRVVGFYRNKGLGVEHAEELAQVVFLKCHKAIEHYDVSQRALPWFFTIVANTFRDDLRLSARKIELNAARIEDSPEPGLDSENPEQVLTTLIQAQELSTFSKTLSPQQSRVLDLRVGKDMSFKDIGKETQQSESAVRKVWSRIIQKAKGLGEKL